MLLSAKLIAIVQEMVIMTNTLLTKSIPFEEFDYQYSITVQVKKDSIAHP